MSADPAAVLRAHVGRFNDGVRSGDYGDMVRGFTPDAEMLFEGIPVGPFLGRDAIAEAYVQQPPSDEIRLLGVPLVEADSVESAYAWAREGRRAGRLIATVDDGLISRLVVTFE